MYLQVGRYRLDLPATCITIVSMTKAAMKELSDQQLVSRVIAKQTDFFAKIIDRYQQKLFFYTLRYVTDADRAEDVVQESFIKMYTNLQNYDQNKPFSPWAYRITHNEAINFIKKNSVYISADKNWLDNIPDETTNLENDLNTKMASQAVKNAVYDLPIKYREVVILYYFENQEYEQISDTLHISVSTVGTRIRRAKTKLKKSLNLQKVTL
jgi:RNA polymerase sigma-70 factor, ECF subfamily